MSLASSPSSYTPASKILSRLVAILSGYTDHCIAITPLGAATSRRGPWEEATAGSDHGQWGSRPATADILYRIFLLYIVEYVFENKAGDKSALCYVCVRTVYTDIGSGICTYVTAYT